MKEKGSDWHYMATPGEEGQRAGFIICLSKATTQVPVSALFLPLPRVTLLNNKKRNKNQRNKER